MEMVTRRWRRAVAFAALAAIAVGTGACSSDGTGSDAGRCAGCPTFDESTPKIKVDSDQDFVIALGANPSTGYRWDVTAVSDPDVVRMTADVFRGSDPAMPGAPGTQRLEFAADRQGHATVRVRYSRSFQPTDPMAREVVFRVTVD